jgi:hypothetical protein
MCVVIMSEFCRLPIGRVFSNQKITYVKKSTRTARVQSSGELVYFKDRDTVFYETSVSQGNYGLARR